ncbi:MAG: hypothetical protein ACRYFZ_12155 [Janthinobacterium lividum]
MNASPHFRYYAAFALILMLVLMLRVQASPGSAAQPDEAAVAGQVAANTGSK